MLNILTEITNNPILGITIFFLVITLLVLIGKGWGALFLSMIIIGYILMRKYWPGGPREAMEDFGAWLGRKEFGPQTETEKQNLSELISSAPTIGNIESIRKKLFTELEKYIGHDKDTQELNQQKYGIMSAGFVVGYLDKLDHYFRLVYANLGSVINSPEYPQHNMVFALDNQRQILQTIHDFVFVDGTHSDLPRNLSLIRRDLAKAFEATNDQIALIVNNRNGRENNITTTSGFLGLSGEPLPNGTFRDKYELY